MGLIGGIARTAVAAGTWTAVSNRVNRRQSDRWAQQDQQRYAQQQYAAQPAVPVQPPQPARDRVDQLKDLAHLKQQGILTEQEFEMEKARILAA
jgi:hypothetical protein